MNLLVILLLTEYAALMSFLAYFPPLDIACSNRFSSEHSIIVVYIIKLCVKYCVKLYSSMQLCASGTCCFNVNKTETLF